MSGPINHDGAFGLVQLPPTHKIRVADRNDGYCCKAPDVTFVFGVVGLDLVDPPVVGRLKFQSVGLIRVI